MGAFGGAEPFLSVEGAAPAAVARLQLGPNIPNPFNPRTRIPFRLAIAGEVWLGIYDARGAAVRELLAASLRAGDHVVGWDGRNETGAAVPSGRYVARLRIGELERRLSLILVK